MTPILGIATLIVSAALWLLWSGGTPASRTISILGNRLAFRCSSHWMRSWAFPTVFATPRIARLFVTDKARVEPDSLSTAPASSAAQPLMVQWTASETREAVRGLAAMELTTEAVPEVAVEAEMAEAAVAVVAAAVDLVASLSNVSRREREY